MTRGCRNGLLTKAQLFDRLDRCGACRALTVAERRDKSLREILGHALYYNLVTEKEYRETVPRDETTIPCYLRPLLDGKAPPETAEIFDQYVITASKMYHRGSLVANYVAMRLYGSRVRDEVQRASKRYDSRGALQEARPYLDFVNPPDVRNSPFKQVFLPERWPTEQVPLHPDVATVLAQKGQNILPSEPEGWRDVMPVTGWDNVLNRMATKLSGNIQVHCRANLVRRVGGWLGATTSLRGGHAVPVLEDVLRGRLRPLILHDDDWTLLTDLRRTLGVSDEEPIYAPPKLAPYSDEVLALHMFVVRYGAVESAYMPVARRGRKFAYLDVKVVGTLLRNSQRRKRKTTKDDASETTGTKKRKTKKDDATTAVVTENTTPQAPGGGDDFDSESLGSMLGLTPEAFNAGRTRIRHEIQKKLSRPRRSGACPSDFQRRLKKKRMRLGAGRMHPEAVIQSLETDGVGARLCVKTPQDMIAFVVPLRDVETADTSETTRPRKRMKRGEWLAMMAAKREADAAKEREEHDIVCERRRRENPVTMGMDQGLKKLMATAVSTIPLKKPTSEMFTRSCYYSEMR